MNKYPDRLQQATVTIIPNEQCRMQHQFSPELQLCAGYMSGGIDACQVKVVPNRIFFATTNNQFCTRTSKTFSNFRAIRVDL